MKPTAPIIPSELAPIVLRSLAETLERLAKVARAQAEEAEEKTA